MKPIFSPAPETKHAFYGMLKPTSAYILLDEILCAFLVVIGAKFRVAKFRVGSTWNQEVLFQVAM